MIVLKNIIKASMISSTVIATTTGIIRGGATTVATAAAAVGSSSSSGLLNTVWIVETCSQLAPVTAMILFAAPIPTILQITKDKSVQSLPLLPYSSMIANAILWTTYGILRKESSIYTCNGVGIILSLLYVLQFIKYSPKRSSTLPGSVSQHITTIICVLLGAVAFAIQPYIKSSADIIGSIAVLFCMAMFASPLSAIQTVINTKSASSIPLPLAIASIANCILWLITGVYKMKDFNVIIPNFMGLASGITQIILKIKYATPKTTTNPNPKLYDIGL